ncbi:hypothetical protein B7P43_G16046 [Cryptotermes secundus]|uniref:Odorant receptor n=1 Tax=Cryptotermes secundus TaxID=105785 RepID=A0A2J7RLX6_9NEOP|nr:hypothetical protein B7P43_G16046 [Cryptotermes secundus]
MITNVFMGVGWLTLVTWAIIPCAKGYIEFVLQMNQDDIEENRGKYFGIAMWLPPKVNRSPMYEITQVLHGFSVFTCAMCVSGIYISMLALMYHTASHFSMLVDLIEELDVIISESIQSGPQWVRQRREGEDVGQTLRCKDAGKEGSQRLIVDRDTLLYQHLVLCTRYHQQLIDFCYQMNRFLSPVLLIIFFFSEALMCLSTFRLAHGSADAESVKFFMSGSSFSLWLLTFCWAGEYLTEKSLAVERAVYACPWYQHLQAMRDIQFVIMRAQNPVRLTAGKFYVVSLETYLQVQ